MTKQGNYHSIASLGSIAYELGQLKPIEELDFLKDNQQKLELYRMAGFGHYAESELSMRELAYKSATKTLKASGVDFEQVGICIYVAESNNRDEVVNSAEVNKLLMDLELKNTFPIHVSISDCANIVSALRVAGSIIKAGEAKCILLVSADKAPRRTNGRMMFREMSIKSDIALSCLIFPPGEGSYDIIYISQHNTPVQVTVTDSSEYAITKFKDIRNQANRLRKLLDMQPSDYSRIITNNYSLEVTKMLVQLCGFKPEKGYFDNIKRFAHAVAGDVLINLEDLKSEHSIPVGDKLLLMSDSITTSSFVVLKKNKN